MLVWAHNRDIFSVFYSMKVYCVFSLESPHRGDANEYTQYSIFNMNKKNTLNYPKILAMGFFCSPKGEHIVAALSDRPSGCPFVRHTFGRSTSLKVLKIILRNLIQ